MNLSLCYTTSIKQGLRVCAKGWENPLFAKRAKVVLTEVEVWLKWICIAC